MNRSIQPPLVPPPRVASATLGLTNQIVAVLIGAAVLATITFVLPLAGCGKRSDPNPSVGHSSYELGRISLNQTNAEVLAEFVMPQALNVCVCLILEGVDVRNAVQVDDTMRALGTLKAKLELSNISRPAPIISNILSHADFGQFANWYSPDAALVLNPPLISYGDGAPVRRQIPKIDSPAIAVRPGERYRMSLRVIEPGQLTNQVSVRLDHWGTSVNGTH